MEVLGGGRFLMNEAPLQPLNGISRFRAKVEDLERFKGVNLNASGQNQALTVLHVPYSKARHPHARV